MTEKTKHYTKPIKKSEASSSEKRFSHLDKKIVKGDGTFAEMQKKRAEIKANIEQKI